MKITLQQKPQGIAIMFVLVSIFFLSALAFGFAMSMKVETRLALNANNEAEMEWIGRSGVEYARWILGQSLKIPNQNYDSLDQKWAGGAGGTNDLLSDVTLDNNKLGEHGTFSIKITDTERKININTALNNEPLLQHALTLAGVDASDAPTIISSIEDWIDRDNDTRVNGAETEYYQGLNPPYEAKNGPFDDISELLLVKGVTPEIYWGPDWTNHAPPSFQAKDQRSALFDTHPGQPLITTGLVELFTPVSSGLINILTASSAQLQMIPLVDENVANEIIQLRGEVNGPDGHLPYGSPADLLVNTSLGRQMAPQVAQYCTFRSSTFEVQVTVDIGQSHRVYHALVRRNSPNDIQVLGLSWK